MGGGFGQGFDFRPNPELPFDRRRFQRSGGHYTLVRRKALSLEDLNALRALKSEIFLCSAQDDGLNREGSNKLF
jgi:hypothetical protein